MTVRPFTEFIHEGVVKQQHGDIAKARSLTLEAAARHDFLLELSDKISLTNQNANYFVETAYDIILEFIRARLALDGYKASGISAHEAEVAYLREVGFAERDVLFVNELRYWRNGILYYGKRVDLFYAQEVLAFLARQYATLLRAAQEVKKK